jgi:hypothetical protein
MTNSSDEEPVTDDSFALTLLSRPHSSDEARDVVSEHVVHDDDQEGHATWVVERVDINGEEIPLIRHSSTWFPAPLALRYVIKIRFRLGPCTLASDMRAIAHAFNWAENVEKLGSLEEFIAFGKFLSNEQVDRLVVYLRRNHEDELERPVSAHTFNNRLFAVSQFLEWASDPINNGSDAPCDAMRLAVNLFTTGKWFNKEKLQTGASSRREPTTPDEIAYIMRAIGPDEDGQFPEGVFAEDTCYRNFIMFLDAYNSGKRRSELLTTKVEHLPVDERYNLLYIARQQDAPEDPRKGRRPRGKTNERFVPLADPGVLPLILKYRDAPPPLGRNTPRFTTPYLYVTADGNPVSISTADYIIKQIGKYAARAVDMDPVPDEYARARLRKSLRSLSWHRLRHAWAERVAMELYPQHREGTSRILKGWGGWNDEKTMERYIEYARRYFNYSAAEQYLITSAARSERLRTFRRVEGKGKR